MNEKIATRTLANMRVAADQLIAARIARLRIACGILSLVVVTLCFFILPNLVPKIAFSVEESQSTPSLILPVYKTPSATTLKATVHGQRISLTSPDGVILYARAQIEDMNQLSAVDLQWYFLYEDDPGTGKLVALGSENFFASQAYDTGALHSSDTSGNTYPIINLSSSCSLTQHVTSCANVFAAPFSNPTKIAIAANDENGIYIIGSMKIPRVSESCADVLGAACNL
ncbi:hypothetical protein [Glutamicibacter sp. NPDC087344]|uniref:hypothetical protein n=1 Tax=Glutamicibacter sp. NPDC087344 TaxID=3363994 RepID=UPI0037FA3F11